MPPRKRPRSDSCSSAASSADGDPVDNPPNSRATTPEDTAATEPTREALSKEQRFNERYKTTQNTNEQVLALQQEKWKSSVYDHFRSPEILIVRGKVKYRFVCKSHPTLNPITRARHDDSTSNLKRHVDTCDGKIITDDGSIAAYARGSGYDKATFRFWIALWVARRYRPFVIVEDTELLKLFKMLFARVEVPSASTVSRDIKEMFTLSRQAVRNVLQEYKGRMHLSVDGWTAPNVVSFLGVTVHRVVDGKMVSFILDYIRLSRRHTGFYLGKQLKKCLQEYGIEKKILAIIGDNASNNDVMISYLGECLGGINGVHTQVRCLAHVENLVIMAVITPFKITKKTAGSSNRQSDDTLLEDEVLGEDEEAEAPNDIDDPEIDDDVVSTDNEYELDADRELSDMRSIEDIIREMNAEDTLTPEDERVGRAAVTKIMALAKRMFHSPVVREDFKTCCEQVNIKHRLMMRAVATRWNSLADCIARALALRPAIEKLLTWSRYDKSGKEGFRRYRLSTEEWSILEQLSPLLTVFVKATHRLSQSNVPLLHEAIPVIDVLTTKLENVIASEDIHRVVRIAAARGLKVMNKYYEKTDDSIMYRAAMLLHPRYKKEYFRRQKWEDEWIVTAVRLLREQWIDYYKPAPSEQPQDGDTQQDLLGQEIDDFHVIDEWNVGSSDVDALEEYLTAPVVKTCSDPIQYWTMQEASGNAALARMALDFLSAPATSVDMERGFSRGGLMVSKRRHTLSQESIRAATVLGSWADIPGLIPEAEIIRIFKDKSKRGKGCSQEDSIVIESDVEMSTA